MINVKDDKHDPLQDSFSFSHKKDFDKIICVCVCVNIDHVAPSDHTLHKTWNGR